MKTKVGQHFGRERVNESVKVLKVVKDFEIERVTFENRHKNKSCSACRERVNESVKV